MTTRLNLSPIRRDTLVFIDGIYQAAGHGYVQVNRSIKFHTAPPTGSDVVIKLDDSVQSYKGDGVTVKFGLGVMTNTQHWNDFMHKVWTHRENPTVKDVLERLQVVVTLVDESNE